VLASRHFVSGNCCAARRFCTLALPVRAKAIILRALPIPTIFALRDDLRNKSSRHAGFRGLTPQCPPLPPWSRILTLILFSLCLCVSVVNIVLLGVISPGSASRAH
jgi:hypothetical protein